MGYIKLLNERVAALEAKQHQSPNRAESPTYREPTLEDVIELRNCNLWGAPKWLDALKQLGFVRKVTPNE